MSTERERALERQVTTLQSDLLATRALLGSQRQLREQLHRTEGERDQLARELARLERDNASARHARLVQQRVPYRIPTRGET